MPQYGIKENKVVYCRYFYNFVEVSFVPNIRQNLVGKTFGHLTVLKKSKDRGTQHEYKWICQCDCGKVTTVTTAALNSNQDENSQDLINFQNAADDDVETMLNDMQSMGFISDWETTEN